MKTVNIHAAKAHLSALIEEVAAGEEIVIAKAGKPVRASWRWNRGSSIASRAVSKV
jgi:hypothetical protein